MLQFQLWKKLLVVMVAVLGIIFALPNLIGGDDGAGAEYSVIDLGFGLTEELSLAISAPIDDTAGVDEDVIVVMSYSIALK